MAKKLFCALLVALLLLTGCARPEADPEDAYPTLPSFSQERTPLEQLQAAIAATGAAGNYTVTYGVEKTAGDTSHKTSDSQTVTAGHPVELDRLYATAKYLPDNPLFLQAFCQLPLQAIPSNTGTIRFQITDLSWEAADRLLYATSRGEEMAGTLCSVAMVLDASGRLSELSVTFASDSSTVTAFATLTFPESP